MTMHVTMVGVYTDVVQLSQLVRYSAHSAQRSALSAQLSSLHPLVSRLYNISRHASPLRTLEQAHRMGSSYRCDSSVYRGICCNLISCLSNQVFLSSALSSDAEAGRFYEASRRYIASPNRVRSSAPRPPTKEGMCPRRTIAAWDAVMSSLIMVDETIV